MTNRTAMPLSRYIAHLQAMLEQHGDLPVVTVDPFSFTREARPPRLAYRANLRSGEYGPRLFDWFAMHLDADESRRGESVCRIS
jgi:hypothetical protein